MSVATLIRRQCIQPCVLRAFKKTLCFFLCAYCALVLNSCVVPLELAPPVLEEGGFDLFLQPLPQETHRLSFTIGELSARRIDGIEVSLNLRQAEFSGNNMVGIQRKLVSVALPPGDYLGLRMQIDSASMIGEEGAFDLLSPAEPILVEYPFTIQEGRAEVLFLSLSADRLVTDGVFFTPKFSLWEHERILTTLKGFVSNSGSENLTVFNKRSAQVVDAIQVGVGPSGLAIDQQRGLLYVALAKENIISVVDISTSQVVGQVRLRSGDRPTELALSASGNRLLALNRGSSSASIIDTGTLFEQGRIKLDADGDDILISPDESRGYVIHSSASLLSVLDLNSLRLETTKSLDNSPLKGVISTDGLTLYLATDYSGDLLVVDTGSLSVQRKIDIGIGARSIERDSISGLIYAGKQNGEIAIIDPVALMVIDSFLLSESIQSMTIDNEESALFVVVPKSNSLLKIDLVNKRQIGSLELGAVSHAVVVMGER